MGNPTLHHVFKHLADSFDSAIDSVKEDGENSAASTFERCREHMRDPWGKNFAEEYEEAGDDPARKIKEIIQAQEELEEFLDQPDPDGFLNKGWVADALTCLRRLQELWLAIQNLISIRDHFRALEQAYQ